jgi:hypothetical protein
VASVSGPSSAPLRRQNAARCPQVTAACVALLVMGQPTGAQVSRQPFDVDAAQLPRGPASDPDDPRY